MTKRIIKLILLQAVLTFPAYAGHGTIRETDSQIIIEYSGGEEDVKAARAHDAELEKQRQDEESKKAEEDEKAKALKAKMENAARKGARRGVFREE
jgi:hypothetical protein